MRQRWCINNNLFSKITTYLKYWYFQKPAIPVTTDIFSYPRWKSLIYANTSMTKKVTGDIGGAWINTTFPKLTAYLNICMNIKNLGISCMTYTDYNNLLISIMYGNGLSFMIICNLCKYFSQVFPKFLLNPIFRLLAREFLPDEVTSICIIYSNLTFFW
jgi:hypothetical protein